MSGINLKDAFGQTPESVKACVQRSLLEGERKEPVMKRKMKLSLAVALAAVMLLAGAALAVSQLGGLGAIYGADNRPERQALLKDIQHLEESYEGNAVRCTMTEALYDPAGNAFALGWTMEPLAQDDQLYVVCDRLTIGGEGPWTRSMNNMSEYLLDGKTGCSVVGELPESCADTQCEITFSVFRPLVEIVRVYDDDSLGIEEEEARYAALLAEGKLPMTGDYNICVHPIIDFRADMSYSDELAASGLMELTDHFTLRMDIGGVSVREIRTCEGQKEFAFDGYEIRILSCEVTPTAAQIDIEYITDEEPGSSVHGEEWDPMLVVRIDVPGLEFWSPNMSVTIEDPVRLEDGRWSTIFRENASSLQVFPEELVITAGYYDEDFNCIIHTEDAITIKLTDKK